MTKYYVLEKYESDTEGLTIKSPFTYFSESVIECNDLGNEPFMFNTLQEAKDCKKGLDLVFKGRSSSALKYEFIIVQDIK